MPEHPQLPEFQKLKDQATQRIGAQGQQQGEALQRRLASIGNLKSGAALQQNQLLQSDLGQQKEAAIGAIEVQEAQEGQRRKEVQDTRDFASKESKAGRDFAAGESALGRSFASAEAGIGRDFAAGESRLGRDFSAGESALARRQQGDQFDRTFGAQQEQNTFMNKLALDEASMNELTTNFNLALSLGSAGKALGAIEAIWATIDPSGSAGKVRSRSQAPAHSRASVGGSGNGFGDGLVFDGSGNYVGRGDG